MSYFEKIKVFLSDKRGVALVKFGIYIIFIIFVLFYVKGIHEEKDNKVLEDPYISQTTYKEKISFLDNEYELENDSTIKFYLNDEEYEVKEDVVYKGEEIEDFDFYFWNLTPNFIGNLVKDHEAFSKTTYQDKTEEKTYKISLLEFFAKFKGKELNLEEFDDKQITISIKKKNDKVVSVYLDLTNYYYFINDENLEVYITY